MASDKGMHIGDDDKINVTERKWRCLPAIDRKEGQDCDEDYYE
jgi:hypothetical protein